jgi:hypothetical protein
MSVSLKGEPKAPRTTFERACRGYDPQFERTLVEEITETIARVSMVTDRRVIALRTGETARALATCLAFALALSPGLDVSSRLREAVGELAKRIQRPESGHCARSESCPD